MGQNITHTNICKHNEAEFVVQVCEFKKAHNIIYSIGWNCRLAYNVYSECFTTHTGLFFVEVLLMCNTMAAQFPEVGWKCC